jgi:acetyl-CoA carboxylase biotin carboxyl carrier protein
MSEEESTAREFFDLEKIKALVELMKASDLTEVSLRRGDEQCRLRRGSQEVVRMVPANPYQGVPPEPVHSNLAPPEKPIDQHIEIKSPTIGTYYATVSPDDPPLVTIGSIVKPDTVVCIVEAMKVFNQIPAEISGTIVAILVENGDSVEFGQPLFRVYPE